MAVLRVRGSPFGNVSLPVSTDSIPALRMRMTNAYSVADGIFVNVNVGLFGDLSKQGVETYVDADVECAGVRWFSMSSVLIPYPFCHRLCLYLSVKWLTKDWPGASVSLI